MARYGMVWHGTVVLTLSRVIAIAAHTHPPTDLIYHYGFESWGPYQVANICFALLDVALWLCIASLLYVNGKFFKV
jgi:hypothetical protein